MIKSFFSIRKAVIYCYLLYGDYFIYHITSAEIPQTHVPCLPSTFIEELSIFVYFCFYFSLLFYTSLLPELLHQNL